MNTTASSSSTGGGEHFQRCWRIQTCQGCLGQEPDCSWCPFSWTCVPNSNRLQLLAPAWDENVCPHWAERWEIRTRPLGCQVSTITTLTSLVTVASTLALVLLVTLTVLGARGIKAYSKKNPGWWKIWRYDWRRAASECRRRLRAGLRFKAHDADTRNQNREQEPLLPS
ncbi:hypothetical protein GGS23DRAFT_597824 [Durotheca rogersii]|uniref:uncharacterized protein n=1 Tax=Durotheca rogersii TaxID=419775 RepID=UPI00221E5BBC|nr:uncharacterized protein GGS23DRAFT_597824 [Durotheca rogersii]KAI5862209.1 hypothetical protein GGS23DRAFT_597824 [Durotheca rogersii]